MRQWANHAATTWLLMAIAFGIAAVGARPYAGGWNDGSRLAAVESLLDRGTLAIDGSVFCGTPASLLERGHLPYPADRADLNLTGTLDKLSVRGHFHSDKPAVISVLMAALYEPLMWFGAPRPGERPDTFVWIMTLLTSGLGYAVAVGCMWCLGGRLGLASQWRLIWLAAFALATFAPAYTRHVNSHTLQLAAVAGMVLLFVRIEERLSEGRRIWGSLLGLGMLAGFGFNLDFGSGPLLVAAGFLAVALRTRRTGVLAVYSLAVLPWVAAGIGINYAIAGVWLPMNMYPEHFLWPGSPFTPSNLTGFFRHGPLDQFLYAAAMWFGKHGFLNHNLPLMLLLAAGLSAARRATLARPELLVLLGWCGLSWLNYALLSNNMGGGCCSVRWFLPFLVPGFWLLGITLRDRPHLRTDFAILACGGTVLSAVMWFVGPWTVRMIPMMWPIVGVTLIGWGIAARIRWTRNRSADVLKLPAVDRSESARAA